MQQLKKYKSIINKKNTTKAKSKLNSIEILICKTLVDSFVSHDEFVLINNVTKEYDEIKEEIKNGKT